MLAYADCTLQYTVACHPLQIHELPTVVAMVDDWFLQSLQANFFGNKSTHTLSSLRVSSHPLPYENNDNRMADLVVVVVVMGLMLIPPILAAQVLACLPT